MQASGGDSSGGSNKSSISTVSRAEELLVLEQDYVGMSEVSSYPTRTKLMEEVEEEDGAELELGLGLGVGVATKPKTSSWGDYCRILNGKDFPSMVSPPSITRTSVAGTKRAADSAPQEAGSNSPSQVVGWPPIRAYRKNSLVNQARSSAEDNIDISKNDDMKIDGSGGSSSSSINNTKNNQEKGHRKSFFVKVNMDGMPIGRKVDLNAHVCYQTLAQSLEDMFHRPSTARSIGHQENDGTVEARNLSKLLDGLSEYVLTYEDKEGDWMLVGDVPWGLFLSTVRRLRIMRTSDANGLAPRFQHNSDRQRIKAV